MVNETEKTLSLVIAAIKNLRKLRGSNTREILNYLSSVYNISPTVARRQMQTALKRGVAYGILNKNGGHYALSIGNNPECQEVAEQELKLLDYCRRKTRQKKMNLCCKCKRKRRRRRSRRRKKRLCSCKKKRKRKRRRSSRRRRCRRPSRRRRRSRRRKRGCSRRRSRRRRSRRRKLCSCGGRRRHETFQQLHTSRPHETFFGMDVPVADSAVTASSSAASVSSEN